MRLLSLCILFVAAACCTAKPAPTSFLRGVGLGLFASDPDYDYGQLVDEIADHGASDILIVVAWYQSTRTSTDLAPRSGYSPSTKAILRTIRQAKAKGLRVAVLPIVRLSERAPDEWRGRIEPSGGRDLWFATYRNYINAMAAIAQRGGAQRFSVGSELLSLENEREHWAKVIAQARARFSGKLFYSANWDHFDPVTFWDLLDEVSVTAYYELVKDGEAPTVSALAHAWRKPRADLLALRKRTKKPLFISEIGYPSKTTAARYPWDETRAAPLDMAQQALLYQAFCDAFSQQRVLDGVYFWNWFGFGGSDDGEYTPRGKPAAETMKKCFARPWKTPPQG